MGMLAQAISEAPEVDVGPAEPTTMDQATDHARNVASRLMAGELDTEGMTFLVFYVVLPAVALLLILLIAYLLGAWLGRIAGDAVSRRVDETLGRFLKTFLKWSIFILAVVGVLGKFGISVASFAALIAAMGLAIGLAFQGTLSNFAAGVMLLVFRPFKVGDVVNASGVLGKVQAIDLFVTHVDTFDNRRFILPNSEIFGSTVENISHHSERRVEVKVGVEYSADLDRTREVLQQAVDSIEGVIQGEGRGTMVFLSDLGDSSVNWIVRCWVPATVYWDVHQALTRAVKMYLDEAGLGIPFPQRDVHLYKHE